MKRLFECIPENFFKPLNGKYKAEYADCILLIFNTFKPEITYGVNREVIVNVLEQYFEQHDEVMFLEESEKLLAGPREKANEIIRSLKECGWIFYEQVENHQIQVVLNDWSIPVIESFNHIIREEEAEYQGIISQIHATLQNKDLYAKPYELILKGARENTDRLVSELKKLNISIKRHVEKQTNEMDAAQILEHFFEYHQNIGSKAYLRMKTSENISYFRSAIIEKLEEIMSSPGIMRQAVRGYMEVEQETDEDKAYDELLGMIIDMKTAFYRLDDVIEEIDRKHSGYMKNAVMRARFLLSTGNNVEGKILQILGELTEEMNREENDGLFDTAAEDLLSLFQIYPQRFVDMESLWTIPVMRKTDVVQEFSEMGVMTEDERQLYKELLKKKNLTRFSRQNINSYVEELLDGKARIRASAVPITCKRDFLRLIYISIYGNHKANTYRVVRNGDRIRRDGYEFPDFEIVSSVHS